MLATLLSACSSDVSRFDDPFANPFKGSSRFDNPNTGSVRQPSGRDMRRAAPYEPVRTGSTTTETLSTPSTQAMPAASRPLSTASGGTAIQGLNPSAKSSGFNAGVASANYPTLAPVAQRSGTALGAAGSSSGWTAVGGTAITLGQGDTVSSLSSRYGVPASAILAVNGLSPSSKLAPGQQLMIPAYNAVQGSGVSSPIVRNTPRPVEKVAEVRQEVETLGSARTATQGVRRVGAPVETDAEKRAAAKLRELKNAKPAEDDEDETPAKAAKPVKAAPAKVGEATGAVQEKAKAEKLAAEKLRAEKVAAEKVKADKLAAEKAKAEKVAAEKAKAEKLARAEEAKAARVAKAKKAADDVESTGSIPETKLPERARTSMKLASAEADVAPKAAEAKNTEAKNTDAKSADADTFRWPAKGRVISGFGARGAGGGNDGINIALPEGTPVRAAEGGVVVHADDALKGYGKMVLVRHPNGFVSVYANNGELNVKRGETVKRGQVIAHSGASGNVTSPQLHFELRKGAQPIDPTTRLAD